MLYLTTRNSRDAFTAHHALVKDRCAEGGLYLPFKKPGFGPEEIEKLSEKSFVQCVAEMLNLLFRTKLTPWDVDFAIGRNPIQLKILKQRIIVAEFWHNPDWRYESIVAKLTKLLSDEDIEPTDWVKIAIRIAIFYGIFAELKRMGIDMADVALTSGDFSGPMTAWYARQWGIPVRNIICCCNENHSLWELFYQGQIHTDGISYQTMIPEEDVVIPAGLERLIYGCGGYAETNRYVEICRQGKIYRPDDNILQKLRESMHISVVSSQRLKTAIPGVWKTHHYLMSPHTALAYSGLLDYRAKNAATGYALVIAEKNPMEDASVVADCMQIPVELLKDLI